ncbi:MAG: Gfo/Idh/MocA family protein [Beutenbergiaceae bacterium]
MPAEPVGAAVVGPGYISDEYLTTLANCEEVKVRFVAGRDAGAARAKADQHGIAGAGTWPDLMAADGIDLVINLTVPAAHAQVSTAALKAGKHVWSEKPLATSMADAHRLVALADELGLRLGCAPDTFLGPGPQTALAALANGRIGSVTSGFASCQYRGPDYWHPAPEFLFQEGAGPVLDVGPYFLTTLVLIFGSLQRVTARGVITRAKRTVATGPRAGHQFDVTVPSHVTALYEFADGGLVDAIFSFDSPIPRMLVEINGTEGSYRLPAVSEFDGSGVVTMMDTSQTDVPPDSISGLARGTGVIDMARSLRAGVQHRADGRLALHVLEALLATEESMRAGSTVTLATQAPATSR